MLLVRIVVSLIGVEYCDRRQWIFRSLATDLIDAAHPPPAEILGGGSSASSSVWQVSPATTSLPFRLDLPVNVGAPPYRSRKLGIKYILSSTVETRSGDKTQFARISQEVTVLTVHDRRFFFVTMESALTYV